MAECKLTYQEAKILTYGQYPNITSRNKTSEANVRLGKIDM